MPTQEKPPADCLDRRRAGVLLHLTSLPGDGPCGALGADAYKFADFLANGGFTVWQMLPVGPTSDGSPYQTNSAHAGSPRLIALEPLVEQGWLPRAAAEVSTAAAKVAALREAWTGFGSHAHAPEHEDQAGFIRENAYWLRGYALYRALREEQGKCWWIGPSLCGTGIATALPTRGSVSRARSTTSTSSSFCSFPSGQIFVDTSTGEKKLGVRLFGDMPIFVAHDSAEVWRAAGRFRS